MKMFNFQAAKAIYPLNLNQKPSSFVAFKAEFNYTDEENVKLFVGARSIYRCHINGKFVSTRSARSPHGHLRIDEIDISRFLKRGKNDVLFEVVGYVVNENKNFTHESSVFIAEIRSENHIFFATDKKTTAFVLKSKEENVEGLAFGQRIPVEMYYLNHYYNTWQDIEKKCEVEELDEELIFLERGTKLPDESIEKELLLHGVFDMKESAGEIPLEIWWETDNYRKQRNNALFRPSVKAASGVRTPFTGNLCVEETDKQEHFYTYTLEQEDAACLEFITEKSQVGLIGFDLFAEAPCEMDLVLNDTKNMKGEIPVLSDNVRHIIHLQIEPGQYSFESLECQLIKFFSIIIRGKTKIRIRNLYIRKLQYPAGPIQAFFCQDNTLNKIYNAAKNTLLTNTLEFFMDCPMRERGGWSGDSYWMGKAARYILGSTEVEKTMLENFCLSKSTKLMEYSFPTCCCGGEKEFSVMMFSWNLFLILELCDYYRRSGDMHLVELYKERILNLLHHISRFENPCGLLENVPGTVFVDWSGANDKEHVTPVSIPNNCLYLKALEEAGSLFDDNALMQKARGIKSVLFDLYQKIESTKYDLFTMYPFMSDSYRYEDGSLMPQGYYSEAAQYYLFWSGVLTKETAPVLYQKLLKCFGPAAKEHLGTAHLKVKRSGYFIGYLIRMEMLLLCGEDEVLDEELRELSSYMLRKGPETFWETLDGHDSLDHGVGAYFAYLLVNYTGGLRQLDEPNKCIVVRPYLKHVSYSGLIIPCANQQINITWSDQETTFETIITVPDGYEIQFDLPDKYLHAKEVWMNEKRVELQFSYRIKGSCKIVVQM